MPLMAVMFMVSCAGSKQDKPSANRRDVKGSWLLQDISYEGLAAGAKYNITLLDEGTPECLKGSTWVLPNNGFGSYTLVSNTAGCTPGERKINWSYRTENGETMFQFKKLQEGVKAKRVEDGYRLSIISATDDALHLQQQTAADGKMVYINYRFVKAQ